MAGGPDYHLLLQRPEDWDIPALADVLAPALGMVRFDAVNRLNVHRGVLHRTDDLDEVSQLRDRFQSAGIAAEIVPAAELRVLPKATALQKAVPEADGLGFAAAAGRKVIRWEFIALVCAGHIQGADSLTESTRDGDTSEGSPASTTKDGLSAKEAAQEKLYCDLILRGGAAMVRLTGRSFDLSYLSNRGGHARFTNFKAAVLDVAAAVPAAVRNRGIRALETDPGSRDFVYFTEAEFDAERWWLWQIAGG